MGESYKVKCPHPNCEGILRFKRDVEEEVLCICHAAKVLVAWQSNKPEVSLVSGFDHRNKQGVDRSNEN